MLVADLSSRGLHRAVPAGTPRERWWRVRAAPLLDAALDRQLFDHLSREQVEQLEVVTGTALGVLAHEGYPVPGRPQACLFS